MFREMRRARQILSQQEAISILDKMSSGVLALAGDNDYPYALPISYVYDSGKLYFHSAKTGHKIDAIVKNDKASFCVIERDDVKPGEYTTYFRSVIAFGRIRLLEDEAEKRRTIEILARKYSPDHPQGRAEEIEKGFDRIHMIELQIEHITGKEAIELVRARK